MKLFYICIGVFAIQSIFAQTEEKKDLKQLKAVEIKTLEKEKTHYKTENNTNQKNTQNYPLSLSSKSNNGEVKELMEPEPFEPIHATEYTDPNYQINIEKSQQTQKALNASPVNSSYSKPLSFEKQLEIYKEAQKKYEVNSFEYNQIQDKIDKLTFENQ